MKYCYGLLISFLVFSFVMQIIFTKILLFFDLKIGESNNYAIDAMILLEK